MIRKWNKWFRIWNDIVDTGVVRDGQANIASPVPVSSGIENWCITPPLFAPCLDSSGNACVNGHGVNCICANG